MTSLSTDDMKEVIKPLGVRVNLHALINKERDLDVLLNESHVSLTNTEEDFVTCTGFAEKISVCLRLLVLSDCAIGNVTVIVVLSFQLSTFQPITLSGILLYGRNGHVYVSGHMTDIC